MLIFSSLSVPFLIGADVWWQIYMELQFILAGVLVILVLVYLVYTLLYPEKF